MDITEQNLRFDIVYTKREWWDFPVVNDTEFEWEGESQVEQTLRGTMDIRQFIGLILSYELTECNNTLGLQIDTGHIVPAVNFVDGDEIISCYVSVYTDKLKASVISESDEPTEQPVLGKHGIGQSKIAFTRPNELWDKMVDCLPCCLDKETCESYSHDVDKGVEALTKKLLKKLNSIYATGGDKK